jgi:4'-phosphopantetheinyl transferase EntD
MTHCSGYRAAVVARSQTVLSVGIDAEPDAALPPAMLDLVLSSEERIRLCAMSEAFPDRHWDRILFCAKEAVFKAWFPIARSWLDFLDVSVTVRANGTFRAIVHASRVPGVGPAFDGRWAVANGLILTATSVSPSKQDAVEPAAHGDDRVWRKNLPEALA